MVVLGHYAITAVCTHSVSLVLAQVSLWWGCRCLELNQPGAHCQHSCAVFQDRVRKGPHEATVLSKQQLSRACQIGAAR